jgi:hypothetical protein
MTRDYFYVHGYTYKRDIESRLRGSYHNTFTIPAIIKLFLISVFLNKKLAAHNVENFRNSIVT